MLQFTVYKYLGLCKLAGQTQKSRACNLRCPSQTRGLRWIAGWTIQTIACHCCQKLVRHPFWPPLFCVVSGVYGDVKSKKSYAWGRRADCVFLGRLDWKWTFCCVCIGEVSICTDSRYFYENNILELTIQSLN